VLNYAEDGINWAGHGAAAGYNVGDENRHFKLPGSFSEDVKHIADLTGNTGRQGQWVLLLDGESHIQGISCTYTTGSICCRHV